ncbi:MAG: TonB family protein [bacterium]
MGDSFVRYMVISAVFHVGLTGGFAGIAMSRPTPAPRTAIKARVVNLPGPRAVARTVVDAAPQTALAAPAPPPKQAAPREEQVKTAKKAPETKPAPPKKEKKKEAEKPKPQPQTKGSVKEDPRTGGFKGKVVSPAAPPSLLPGGGAASLGVDSDDFTFSYYLVTIQNSVAREWSSPASVAAGQERFTVIYFQIERDGRIVRPTIETKSGDDLFDRTALRAVERASLPPLPDEFADRTLGVHFQFEYAP